MSLNIKNSQAHKLAQELAEETGETMTSAVTVALRERLERVRRKRVHRLSVEEMLEIGKRIRKHLKGPVPDHAELLYDEQGLPK